MEITIINNLGGGGGGNYGADADDDDYDFSKVNYDAVDMGVYYAGLHIGHHKMIQITDIDTDGEYECVQYLTPFYSGAALTDFNFEQEFTTVYETSVSTVEKLSSEISTNIQVCCGVPGASASTSASINSVYTIGETKTYTASQTSSLKVNFSVKPELVADKDFALCVAAKVYEVTFDTWVVEDWWWGDYETAGSRQTHTAYLTFAPTITIEIRGEGLVLWGE